MSDHPAHEIEPFRNRLNVVPRRHDSRFSKTFLDTSELPKLKKLEYVNSSKSQTTIQQHLEQLVDADILEQITLPKDRRRNDLPYTFYGISDSGREFLKEHKLLRAQDTLREIYDRVEKTDDNIRYETTPRPEN